MEETRIDEEVVVQSLTVTIHMETDMVECLSSKWIGLAFVSSTKARLNGGYLQAVHTNPGLHNKICPHPRDLAASNVLNNVNNLLHHLHQKEPHPPHLIKHLPTIGRVGDHHQ